MFNVVFNYHTLQFIDKNLSYKIKNKFNYLNITKTYKVFKNYKLCLEN